MENLNQLLNLFNGLEHLGWGLEPQQIKDVKNQLKEIQKGITQLNKERKSVYFLELDRDKLKDKISKLEKRVEYLDKEHDDCLSETVGQIRIVKELESKIEGMEKELEEVYNKLSCAENVIFDLEQQVCGE